MIISNMTFVSYFSMLCLIPLICCLLFIQWQMYKSARLLKAFRSFPRLPIIGSIHVILGNMQTRTEKFMNLIKESGKSTVFWFSFVPAIMLVKSEDILQSLHREQDRDLLGIFERFFQDGILLARGEKWRCIRRIINQAFTPSKLKQYMPVFTKHSSIMVKILGEKANTGIHIDFNKYAINMNVDISTETMLDYEIKTQESGSDTNIFHSAGIRCLSMESERYSNPILFFDVLFKLYLYLSGNIKWYSIIQEQLKKIIKEKIHLFKEAKENGGLIEKKPTNTLIDILIQIHDEQPEFDVHRINVEMLNMITTASDTTATTLSYICLLLAMHPEVQEKVYQEILSVFKDDFIEVKVEHCNKLRYMEQCIKETIRRFTLVPVTFRRCSEPIELNDEQIIPPNCRVGFFYDMVHQDPSIYPDPEKFDPDRFSPEKSAINAQNFMGFGVGHRACIGAKYAMLSLKTQLVHILRKYKLTTDMQISDIIFILDITSRSKNGYPIQFWHRENNQKM